MTKTPSRAISINKEWAAVSDDEIIETEDTKSHLLETLREQGRSTEHFDIIALPKPHQSILL